MICGCIAGREAEQRVLILAFLHLLLFNCGPLILDNMLMSTNGSMSTEMGEVRAANLQSIFLHREETQNILRVLWI